MRILGVERTSFATNHYRIVQPLTKLRDARLADTSTFHMDDLRSNPERVTELVMGADLIVIYSPSNEDWLDFIRLCRKHGKTVVADFDDDPLNVSPWNPVYRHIGIQEVAYEWPDGTKDMLWSEDMVGSNGEQNFFSIERNLRARDLFAVNFKKVDLVTTTTPLLAETLRAMNPNVAVLPNLIDLNEYPRCEFVKRGIRIGWQGGSSHYEDVWIILEAVRRILEKYPQATFVYFGDLRLSGLFRTLPEHQVECHGWVPRSAYPTTLATLNLDIGLCPLADNAFNRNKSAIKFFEYSAVGAATVASDVAPYNTVITPSWTGLLAKPDDWFMAIETLILDAGRRGQMAEQAYDAVASDHNADTRAHLWTEAYERLLRQPVAV